jgi:Rhodanese-like domain
MVGEADRTAVTSSPVGQDAPRVELPDRNASRCARPAWPPGGGELLDTEVTMPRQIDRDGVGRLADEGAQLVEVLPASEYAKDHLPGAINLPLRRLEQQATAVLDRQRAVIVYCSDSA